MGMIINPYRFSAGGGAPPVTTSGLFNHGMTSAVSNFGASANQLILSKWTNLNPVLVGGTWDKLAIRLGTGVTNGRKIKLYVYDGSFNLLAQTAEQTLSAADSSTVKEYSLVSPLTGQAYGTERWIGVHTDGALNVSFWTNGQTNGMKHSTSYSYASGAPATFVTGITTANHVIDVWAGITVDYGILGLWQGSNPVLPQDDTLSYDSAATFIAAVSAVMPSGTGSARSIDKMYCRVDTITAGNKFRPAIWADSAGSPGALIAEGTEATVATTGEDLEMAITASVTEGVTYWLGVVANGATNLRAQTGATHWKSQTYANPMPNPMGATSNSLQKSAIWARYS